MLSSFSCPMIYARLFIKSLHSKSLVIKPALVIAGDNKAWIKGVSKNEK